MMKEFEKWWRSDNRQATMCADKAAADAWKAALKWAIKSLYSVPVSGHDSSDDRIKMVTMLRKELGE